MLRTLYITGRMPLSSSYSGRHPSVSFFSLRVPDHFPFVDRNCYNHYPDHSRRIDVPARRHSIHQAIA